MNYGIFQKELTVIHSSLNSTGGHRTTSTPHARMIKSREEGGAVIIKRGKALRFFTVFFHYLSTKTCGVGGEFIVVAKRKTDDPI